MTEQSHQRTIFCQIWIKSTSEIKGYYDEIYEPEFITHQRYLKSDLPGCKIQAYVHVLRLHTVKF